MITDFSGWLHELIRYCQLEVNDALVSKITEVNNQKSNQKENINNHLRKGKPGDHKEKLKQDTIFWKHQ